MIKKVFIIICLFFLTNIKVFALSNGEDLYTLIKSNSSNETINFSIRSGTSNTNGIYVTNNTNSGENVYYYRGEVNNNLIFNNMCWKIIRTTESGGIKLIYNGVPTSGKCNSTGNSTQLDTSYYNSSYDDNAYVGYMYGSINSTYKETHKNTNASTIKTYIDNWYSSNFTNQDITNKIEDTIYCSDRSIVDKDSVELETYDLSDFNGLGYEKNPTLYGAASRSWYLTKNPSPSLKCTREEDKFTVSSENGNGKLTYPVGLIDLDEAIYAGFNTHASAEDDYLDQNYLYNGTNYWTITPIWYGNTGSASVGYINANGSTDSGKVKIKRGVRPVISLINGLAVLENQDGTQDNPYTISYYSVIFNNTGDSEIDNQYMSLDNTSKVIKPSDPIKEDYIFKGWYTDKTFTQEYNFDSIVDKPLNLYAKWEEEYTYKFINGDNQTLTKGKINNYSFEIDGNYNKFSSLQIGNLSLDKDNDFIVTTGSTIITFTENGINKINKLDNGEYNIEVKYTNNKTSIGKLKIVSETINQNTINPDTIDNINTNIIYCFISLVSLLVIFYIKKKSIMKI